MGAEITTGVFENSGTTYNYRYDHQGMLVYKQKDDNFHTLRGAFGEALASHRNGSLDYWNILRPDGTVIGRWEGSTRLHYHRDYLDSTRTIVNASGGVVQTYDYYPFGLEMPQRSETLGTSYSRERFTGHERDEEVGLGYMIARRYDVEIGRFLSVDPILNEANHQYLIDFGYYTIDPYNYVFNNPINLTDPDGRCATCIGFVVAGVIGAGVAYFRDEDVTTGFLSGASAGAIAGAFIDAVPTGGGSLLLVGAAVTGGATGGAVGNVINQVGKNYSDGQDIRTAIESVDGNQVFSSAVVGGATGLLGGIAGSITNQVASTTPSIIAIGSRALNNRSTELFRQGSSTGTVHGAQDAIVNGMYNAAVNTANNVIRVNTTTVVTTTAVMQVVEDENQRRRQE